MRVLPATRVVGAVLIPILAVTTVALWGLPGETHRLFAWTIKPDLTPLLMGAGYGSGVVFFSFVARGGYWLEVSFGFVGIGVFSTLMGIATAIHWEKFNHDHPAFFGWLALYVVAPFLIPGLWAYNGGWRRGPAMPPDRPVPPLPRLLLAVAGGLSFAIGLAIFVRPSLAIDHWPWDLTPLTARVVGSFLALNVGWAAAALDGRWSAIRIPALSQVAGLTLLLLGVVRGRDDLHTGRASTWIYVGANVAMLALLTWLVMAMSLRRPAALGPPVVNMLELSSITSVPEAIARLREIEASAPRSDGVVCFARLYREVTEGVNAQLAQHTFADNVFLESLDVCFAGLFFTAYDAYEREAASTPPAWAPLFQQRSRRGIAPLQFAFAGMNPHINRDLPVALVTTCRTHGIELREGSPEHADFLRINALLAGVESKIKRSYLSGWAAVADRIVHRFHRIDDVIAMWDVERARDAAWTNGEALWRLRDEQTLASQFLLTLDRMVGLASRGLLVPADSALRKLGRFFSR